MATPTSSTASASSSLTVPPAPHQPASFKFPKKAFGKSKVVERAFQASWFLRWKWLHYDEANDLVFCHPCMKAHAEGKLRCRTLEPAFIRKGFSNWKDATSLFRKHEESSCHKEAVEAVITLPRVTCDVGELLSQAHAVEKEENRRCLRKILSNIRFLARQACALRGDHDESDSNFVQLLKLRGEDDPKLFEWMKKKTNKYTSSDMQNEMLEVMGLSILRDIASCIQNASFFTIMADETTDKSNREQVVLVLRWVDDDLNTHEDFIGLYMVPSIDSDTLVSVIRDCLVRMNLTIANCRGQCYDGASSMSGAKTGVAKQISDKEKRAVYTHCYGHALNLAVGDSIKKSKIMRDALDTTFSISQLIKFSPKRDTLFEKLKNELAPETPGFRVLCPTRWTVRADSLESVLANYSVLQELWEECSDSVRDAETRARIGGVAAQMRRFDYFFGVSLGELLLRHSDNLSKTLQHKSLSAAQGQEVATLSVKTLQKIRNDEAFSLFWAKVLRLISELDVSEPSLPRRRKHPRRYEEGDAEPEFSETVEDLYRKAYFEALDLVIECIKDRFDQPGYKIYRNLQDLLLKATASDFDNYKEEFQFVTTFYGPDFTPSLFKAQLELLNTYFTERAAADGACQSTTTVTVHDIMTCVQSLSRSQQTLMSEVITLIKLVLVMPATNATSERSFSALRRVKTYLRSTMSQARLNSLMTLHVHKNRTDSLNLTMVANEFVQRKEGRLALFGKFS